MESPARPLAIVTPPEAAARPTLVGGAGTPLRAGFLLYDDPNTETRGPLWYGQGTRNGLAWQMVRDPHVRMCLEAAVSPLLAARWDVEPASEKPIDQEVARFVSWNFFERLDWQRFVHTASIGYTRDGFSLHEFTDDTISTPAQFKLHPGRGNCVAYTGVHHRPAFTKYRWLQSKNDPTKIAGVEQLILGADAEEAGIRKISLEDGALLFRMTWEQEGADFEGFPVLRSAYGPFKEKRLLKVVLMIYYERAGNALPEISEPENSSGSDKTEREIADEIARSVRVHEQAYLRLPPGWKFDWKQPAQAPQQILEAIESTNRDIAIPFNVAWMLLSTGGSSGAVGSRALASEQRGQYTLASEKQARFWEFALNVGQDGWSPVERIVRLNYGADVQLPRIVVRSMPLRDMKDQLSIVPQLVQCGALIMDDPARAHLRVALDMPKADPSTADKPDELAPLVAPGGDGPAIGPGDSEAGDTAGGQP